MVTRSCPLFGGLFMNFHELLFALKLISIAFALLGIGFGLLFIAFSRLFG
jgi:hypothetical protein